MSYKHFTLDERGKLELMVEAGMTCTSIADRLGRHRTSVMREIRRNRHTTGYHSGEAQQQYCQRRKACRPKGKLNCHSPLREYVIDRIAMDGWTPELVAGRLMLEFPDTPKMRISHETIYRKIYTTGHYLDLLIAELPQARKKRRKRGQGKSRRGPSIRNRVGIAKRPGAVETREEFGHWEGDTVVGKNQDGFIVTLVERKGRLLAAKKSETKRAGEVMQAVIDALQDYPVSWVKTITTDNGTEFAEHEAISDGLSASVYFADPYSAYQRGSNEQVNGLIRRRLPKGTSFKGLTQQQLDEIVENINNRPRKCLGYRTPNEVFNEQREMYLRALRA